jgi:hypothetical protein
VASVVLPQVDRGTRQRNPGKRDVVECEPKVVCWHAPTVAPRAVQGPRLAGPDCAVGPTRRPATRARAARGAGRPAGKGSPASGRAVDSVSTPGPERWRYAPTATTLRLVDGR